MKDGKRAAAMKAVAATVAAGAVVAGSAPAWAAADTTWTQVTYDIQGGLSGAAHLNSGWVVAHDNKTTGQTRLSLLSKKGELTPLSWAEDDSLSDVEALAAVPHQPGSFAVLGSNGKGAVVHIAGTDVVQQATFTVPDNTGGGGKVIESLALVPFGARMVAVWGTRGATTWPLGAATPTTKPASIYAATFAIADGKGTFGTVDSGTVTVPAPTVEPNAGGHEVRHVADLAIGNGRLIGPAAIDRGDDGIGDSVLYDLGSVGIAGTQAQLHLDSPVALATYPGHKVEAVGCWANKGLLGTDDENHGGFIAEHPFC